MASMPYSRNVKSWCVIEKSRRNWWFASPPAAWHDRKKNEIADRLFSNQPSISTFFLTVVILQKHYSYVLIAWSQGSQSTGYKCKSEGQSRTLGFGSISAK